MSVASSAEQDLKFLVLPSPVVAEILSAASKHGRVFAVLNLLITPQGGVALASGLISAIICIVIGTLTWLGVAKKNDKYIRIAMWCIVVLWVISLIYVITIISVVSQSLAGAAQPEAQNLSQILCTSASLSFVIVTLITLLGTYHLWSFSWMLKREYATTSIEQP